LNKGEYLFLDEVHKYPNWSRELKLIYDDISDIPQIRRDQFKISVDEFIFITFQSQKKSILKPRIPELMSNIVKSVNFGELKLRVCNRINCLKIIYNSLKK
jgi:hypothetical protein